VQLLQHGWATGLEKPKTEGSDAAIAFDTIRVS